MPPIAAPFEMAVPLIDQPLPTATIIADHQAPQVTIESSPIETSNNGPESPTNITIDPGTGTGSVKGGKRIS